MIVYSDFMQGRDITYAKELTTAMKASAIDLIARINLLLTEAGLTALVSSSGWRPAAVNSATKGAAKKSNHMMCLACDVRDPNRLLQKWCMANTAKLVQYGLWMEHPRDTPTWCHLQSVPPRSGNRVFYAK